MRWSLAGAAALALVLAGCAGRPAPVVPPAPPAAAVAPGLLYVTSADHAIRVIDTATGLVVRTLPAGAPAPDWRRLYALLAGRLEVVDPATGLTAASRAAPAWARVVQTSADGRWLALAGDGPGDHFQVRDAALERPPVEVRLSGRFTVDGLSGDGRRLYLLEWLDPGHYQIRMYSILEGRLAAGVIADKREIGQAMSGEAVRSLTTGDGMVQLTLYQRSAKGEAFVHALPIGQDTPFAWCEDLPAPAEGWGFAGGPPASQRFYAVNAASGRVVELTVHGVGDEPTLRQASAAGPGAPGGQPAAAVSPDGRTLYAALGGGLVAIDTASLTVRARGLAGHPLTGLATSPEGAEVYAIEGSARLLVLDARSLTLTRALSLGGQVEAIQRAT